MEVKKMFDTEQICAEQFVNSRGNIMKKYCIVKDADNYYKVKHSFEEVSKLISSPRVIVKGF